MEKRVMEALMELGVPTGNKGYRYLVESITRTIENEGEIGGVTKVLYPEVAKKFKTTASRVERAIRHAVDTVFNQAKPEVIYKYFNNYIGAKLSNRNFISAIAFRIMNEEV